MLLAVMLALSVFLSACSTATQADIDLHRMDLAIGTRDMKLAGNLAKKINHDRLSLHQKCLLKLYTARYFRISGQNDRILGPLRQIRRHCTHEFDIFAWSVFELGLYTKNPAMKMKVFANVLNDYPDRAAAHPALFELLTTAKKVGADPSDMLKKAYIRHPESEMAAEFLYTLTGMLKGRERVAVLTRLAMQFPNHPLGAKARLILVKKLEPKDPVGALEVLYKLAYGTEKSLLIGSYATGVEGPALLEAARVWDRYMNKPGRAEKDYRRFIKKFSSNNNCDDALYEVYSMYERRGRGQKALKILKELARRFPDGAKGMLAAEMLKKGEK